MFLLIDNFDSFTFNLVQAFQQQGRDPLVLRNDRPEILELAQSGELSLVCISPGPSRPENAGLCLDFLARLPRTVPVLGVCLGHQILGHFAGAPVVVAERIMHGKTSPVEHRQTGLFAGLPNPMQACRYHSLLVQAEKAPDALEVTAWTEAGEVMGLRYADRPWVGVQFHPESVLTPDGPRLLANFPDGIL
jgi:anthranilate synthase component 2